MKAFEMIALGNEVAAYHAIFGKEADRMSAEIDRLKAYLETTDLPDDLADAIEDAKNALEEKYFNAATECAERIRNSEAFKHFMETWKAPEF